MMAHYISDTIKSLQQTVDDLQNNYDKMKEKVDKRQFNSGFSEEISTFEGIEKRLETIEEEKIRNRSRMQAVLNLVGTLSEKLDSVSTIISECKDKVSPEKEIPEFDCFCSGSKKETSVLPLVDKEQRLGKPEDEPEAQTSTSTKNENHRHQEATYPKQSLQNRTEINKSSFINSYDNKSRGGKPKTDNKLMPKNVVASGQKVNIPKQRRSGYKVCGTVQKEDNRICCRQNSECFQGTLLQPPIESFDKQNQPAPNIFRKQESLCDDSTHQSHKASGIMTMAQMAERDYESKQNVHSLSEWAQIAEQSQLEVTIKLAMNPGKKGRGGHDYVLLLDTSGSMRGEKFDLMIKTSLEYIEGLQIHALQYGVRDNVGLACFGEETKLLLSPSTDYDGLKEEIRKLHPRGPSPLAAGLLMALSGTVLCGSVIGEHDFKPCIILMTDGMPTNVEAPTEKDNMIPFSSPMLQDLLKDHELKSALGSLRHRVQLFCVPFGSTDMEAVNILVTKTHGKIIPHTQINRLSRLTLNIVDATQLVKELETATDINRALVKQAVVKAGYQTQDLYDDVTDIVLMLLDPSSHGRFKPTKWPTLPLGSRVRRGPHWHWKNQDSNMAGTVIGEDVNGEVIWVEWDSGHKNCYTFSETLQNSDLKVVNEPRILVDDLIAVGCKVKRGNKWKYGEQDGGKGSKGTVLRVKANGKVVVYWDKGRLGTYRFDDNEIEVCEDRQTISSSSSHPMEAETFDNEPKSTEDMPLILPTHNAKDVSSIWQYQDETEQWISYDEDTNFKVEKAFSRNPHGKCIIEIDKTIGFTTTNVMKNPLETCPQLTTKQSSNEVLRYQVIFSKMIQRNNKDKNEQQVRRLEKDKNDDSPTDHSTLT